MKARIKITLKNGVLDPQGKAIQNASGEPRLLRRQRRPAGQVHRGRPGRDQRGQGARAGRADLQGAARQHRDRELRLRAGAVTAESSSTRSPHVQASMRRRPGGALAAVLAASRPPARPLSTDQRPSRTRSSATAWRCRPAAGTTRAPARSTPSARPSSTPKRAPRPAPPPAGAGGRRRDGPRRCRQGARRPRAALRRGAVQGGAARGGVRRGRRQHASRSTTPSRFSKRRESCTRPSVACPGDQVPGRSASGAPRCVPDHARPALSADGACAEGGLRAAQGDHRRVLRELPRPARRSKRTPHESLRRRLSRLQLRPRRQGRAGGGDRPARRAWSGTATPACRPAT